VILDNYAAHKHAKVRAWLQRHCAFALLRFQGFRIIFDAEIFLAFQLVDKLADAASCDDTPAILDQGRVSLTARHALDHRALSAISQNTCVFGGGALGSKSARSRPAT
jgi:hypothetical protein